MVCPDLVGNRFAVIRCYSVFLGVATRWFRRLDGDKVDADTGPFCRWDDSLSDLEAAFRSWFIANDGRDELQKSGGSNSRKQIVQLSSRNISAGNLVFSS